MPLSKNIKVSIVKDSMEEEPKELSDKTPPIKKELSLLEALKLLADSIDQEVDRINKQ